MKIDLRTAAELLLAHDYIQIHCHERPDGDTVGSATALCLALRDLGKHARIHCSDPIPPIFDHLTLTTPDEPFEPQMLVAVDCAAVWMLGEEYIPRAGEFLLCIDHHPSNELFAQNVLLDPDAAACADIILELVRALGAPFTKQIANAVYTGLSTDTGCFRFSNTNGQTLRHAADAVEAGADNYEINSIHFIMKSRERIRLESLLLSTVEYYMDGRVSVLNLTNRLIEDAGVPRSEADSLAYLARQVIGVEVGILFKETPEGTYKISVRTSEKVNATELCARFGGGGHARASGCKIDADFPTARDALLKVVAEFLA